MYFRKVESATHFYKAYFNWSTGKDSAMALHHVLKSSDLEIAGLITTINSEFDRVSMHGIRRELLEAQFEALGIPGRTIEIPGQVSMEDYEQIMLKEISDLKNEGFKKSVFGDIFLEDLRAHREEQLRKVGIECYFPLWKKNTAELIRYFIQHSFKAIVVCIDCSKLDESFLGRTVDESFMNDLPADVDPCGENGEFHTFCYDGPIFNHPILFQKGDKVLRTYPYPTNDGSTYKFYYLDLMPV